MSTLGKMTDKAEKWAKKFLQSEAGKEFQRDLRELGSEIWKPLITSALPKFKPWVPENWRGAIVTMIIEAVKSALFEPDDPPPTEAPK